MSAAWLKNISLTHTHTTWLLLCQEVTSPKYYPTYDNEPQLSVAISLINRGHSYRWVAGVSWLNYLIGTIDHYISSAQHSGAHRLLIFWIHLPYFTSTMLHPRVSNAIRIYGSYNTPLPQILLSSDNPGQDIWVIMLAACWILLSNVSSLIEVLLSHFWRFAGRVLIMGVFLLREKSGEFLFLSFN